ncbi:MAG: TonB-dependent receptor [Acidimicrobiia bacterium]|nr:TonB-dependent receptor [Acidimicrobiia bacterium]
MRSVRLWEVLFVSLLVLWMLVPSAALAQTGQGTVTGLVTDASGAVLAGAKVRLTERSTGFSYSPVTNEQGLYRTPYLNPGTYEMVFEAQGFKRLVRSNIMVRATETLKVDAQLEIGAVVESVEVAAGATLLETETSTTGHLVTGTQLVKLPTPQMKVESMLWYVPNVTSQAGFGHAAGSRSRSFVMATDGVSGLTPGTGVIGTGRNMSTVQHAMEEIKVLTTALPAEYGHSGGGMMSIVFKSGTNSLHGLAEERYMARHMIHRNFQDANLPTNNFGFHLMSGTISGPIVIPKLYNGRNRTFFLAGFQRHHEKASENNDRTVPSPAMLAGDFSFGGIGDPIYDPASLVFVNGAYSRTQFPGNRLPLSRVDPVFNKFMSFNPYTGESNRNNQAFINRLGPQNNLSADTVYRSYRTGFDYKVDHSFSDGHKIFGRYSNFRHRAFQDRWQIAVANPIFDFNFTPIPINQRQVVISDSYTINPTTINEIRIGANRRKFSRDPQSVGQGWAATLGIPNVGPETMPDFRNSGGGTLINTFPRNREAQANENISVQENLTLVRGRHTFKTGYEILRTRHNIHVDSQPSGIYRMGGTEFPFRPNTGNAFASFMLGGVVRADYTRDLATWLPQWWSHALYFQDDWKVTPNLTLNLGLRWQYESPFSTKYGQQSQFNPTAIDPLTGRQGALLHPKGLLAGRDWNNLQPRVGLAYHFNPKWVFRGGFAVNTLDLWTNGLNENFEEYFASAVVQPEPGNPDVAFYLRNGPPRFSFNIAPDGSAPFVGTNFTGRSASYYDPNMRMPYTMNWNLGFQWEFARNLLLDIGYQGSSGVGLLNRWDINAVPLDISTDPVQLERVRQASQNFRPFPHFGSVLHYANYGHSSFHSGTIKVEKRFSQGFSLTSFYTWSRSIDEASDDGGAGGITFYNRRLEKGRSNFDVPHRWVSYALWELPFGRGKKWLRDAHWLTNGVLGNWELNVIQTFENGIPFNFGFTGSPNVYLPGGQRPNFAPGKTFSDIKLPWDAHGPCRHQVACALPWADINAFAYPASFTPGNVGRNVQTGPGMLWHQASIAKVIPVGEKLKGSLRFDINNPFKRYFFNPPGSTVDFRNPQNFGKITGNQGSFSGLGGRLYMQVVFKLEF